MCLRREAGKKRNRDNVAKSAGDSDEEGSGTVDWFSSFAFAHQCLGIRDRREYYWGLTIGELRAISDEWGELERVKRQNDKVLFGTLCANIMDALAPSRDRKRRTWREFFDSEDDPSRKEVKIMTAEQIAQARGDLYEVIKAQRKGNTPRKF